MKYVSKFMVVPFKETYPDIDKNHKINEYQLNIENDEHENILQSSEPKNAKTEISNINIEDTIKDLVDKILKKKKKPINNKVEKLVDINKTIKKKKRIKTNRAKLSESFLRAPAKNTRYQRRNKISVLPTNKSEIVDNTPMDISTYWATNNDEFGNNYRDPNKHSNIDSDITHNGDSYSENDL